MVETHLWEQEQEQEELVELVEALEVLEAGLCQSLLEGVSEQQDVAGNAHHHYQAQSLLPPFLPDP